VTAAASSVWDHIHNLVQVLNAVGLNGMLIC